jgi:hypothetical protein
MPFAVTVLSWFFLSHSNRGFEGRAVLGMDFVNKETKVQQVQKQKNKRERSTHAQSTLQRKAGANTGSLQCLDSAHSSAMVSAEWRLRRVEEGGSNEGV